MGGFISKKIEPEYTGPSAVERVQEVATVPFEKAVKFGEEAVSATQEAQKQSAMVRFLWLGIKGLASLLAIVIIWDYLAIKFGFRTLWWPSPPTPQDDSTPQDGKAKLKSSGRQPLLKAALSNVTGPTSSGDLLNVIHDATTSVMVPATSAPLSSENQGSYGFQWWMFIQDWNYGYGKEKDVVIRTDPTNNAVMNPRVSLHPTDNTLKFSISIFPKDDKSSKNEPAPAGTNGEATDDVYTCEVTNIPLQSWFSLSMTVFSRNLDIYIDGKLVKSCLLPGVPKPAVGNIMLTPNGGYSGYMCNFYAYPRMLTPGDALNFFSAGTPCQNQTPSPSSGLSKATGYSVKIGVYDTVGKEVQEYTF